LATKIKENNKRADSKSALFLLKPMKFFKSLFHFYIHSSLHIATSVWAFLQITTHNLQISSNPNLEIIIFFGTQFTYTFLKNFTDLKNKTFQIKNHRSLTTISLISLLFVIYILFHLSPTLQIAFIKIGLLIILYPYFRQFGWLKIFIVAFVFAYITVYIPALDTNLSFFLYQTLAIQRFIIVLCLILPFEILDSETDPKSLKTIPQRIGITKTKILGLLLLTLYFYFDIDINIDIAIAIIIAFAIIFANPSRNRYYSLFWVESIPIFWWILLR
jgi:hypothetical protein